MIYRKENTGSAGNHEEWIDLLRIICMFWVILFHFADHGTVDMATAPLTANWVFLAFCRAGGGIANCTFVLITGYLLSEKHFKLSRICLLWLEVWMYSVASYILSTAIDENTAMDFYGFAKSCVPILKNRYWFFSSYLLLYMLMPILNKFMCKVSLAYHAFAVIALMACFSMLTIIPKVTWMNSQNNVGMFVTLYLLGGLFNKVKLREQAKKKLLFFSLILLFGLIGTETILKMLKLSFMEFDFFVWPMVKPTVVVAASMLFLALKGTKYHMPKLVFACAQSTFGVYLIHIGTLQTVIFKQIFDIAPYFEKAWFPFILISYAVLIYAVCVCIDRVRFYLIERYYQLEISRAAKWIEERIKGMLSKTIGQIGMN